MNTSDWVFDTIIAAFILLKLLELFKISKLGKLQKQVDAQQTVMSNLQNILSEMIDSTVIEKKQILDVLNKHEKNIVELQQKIANDSRKI